ncbi:type II 3-dehydroquinate dehydratase [bacterium]|nr:type II 3-dehydroquinate dehydratase [bacterium]
MRVFVLHGPNLNMLGTREPGIYGDVSYEQMMGQITAWAENFKVELGYAQTNSEGALIDYLYAAVGQFDVIILNPGAFTHTSYALRDAIVAVSLPVIEVHISNIYNREEWRAKSIISPVCVGTISGLGILGYRLALEACQGLWGDKSISVSSASGEAVNPVVNTVDAGGLTLDMTVETPKDNYEDLKSVAVPGSEAPLEEFDPNDLSNLFMPSRRYEAPPKDAVDLGNNCGINEIQGFAEEGVESVFIGNSEIEADDPSLSKEERKKLREWMGNSGSFENDRSSSPFQPGESGVDTGLSSSESYKAIAAVELFASSRATLAKTVDADTSAPKRLSIPIKPKK